MTRINELPQLSQEQIGSVLGAIGITGGRLDSHDQIVAEPEQELAIPVQPNTVDQEDTGVPMEPREDVGVESKEYEERAKKTIKENTDPEAWDILVASWLKPESSPDLSQANAMVDDPSAIGLNPEVLVDNDDDDRDRKNERERLVRLQEQIQKGEVDINDREQLSDLDYDLLSKMFPDFYGDEEQEGNDNPDGSKLGSGQVEKKSIFGKIKEKVKTFKEQLTNNVDKFIKELDKDPNNWGWVAFGSAVSATVNAGVVLALKDVVPAPYILTALGSLQATSSVFIFRHADSPLVRKIGEVFGRIGKRETVPDFSDIAEDEQMKDRMTRQWETMEKMEADKKGLNRVLGVATGTCFTGCVSVVTGSVWGIADIARDFNKASDISKGQPAQETNMDGFSDKTFDDRAGEGVAGSGSVQEVAEVPNDTGSDNFVGPIDKADKDHFGTGQSPASDGNSHNGNAVFDVEPPESSVVGNVTGGSEATNTAIVSTDNESMVNMTADNLMEPVTIQPGDNPWKLIESRTQYGPATNLIKQIYYQYNDLDPTKLHAGDVIKLPTNEAIQKITEAVKQAFAASNRTPEQHFLVDAANGQLDANQIKELIKQYIK